MVYLIAIVVYLLVGFAFNKPKEWSLFGKILGHIFWLPVLFLILVAFKKGNAKV